MTEEAHPHELPAPKQPVLEANHPVHRRCIHIFLVALSLPQEDAPLEAPTPCHRIRVMYIVDCVLLGVALSCFFLY
jgi:hypothetical protein